MSCWALPTSWEASCELDLETQSAPYAEDAQAVWITALWVACLSGGRFVQGKFVGSSFFVFGPRATSCELVYSIKADLPDPETPGQVVPPPYFNARVWEDYPPGRVSVRRTGRGRAGRGSALAVPRSAPAARDWLAEALTTRIEHSRDGLVLELCGRHTLYAVRASDFAPPDEIMLARAERRGGCGPWPDELLARLLALHSILAAASA
jgi:hypothetical protein